MSTMRWILLYGTLVLLTAPAQAETCVAGAEGCASATFALIIGVNRSVDKNTPQLKYADDDAARYLDLFRTLGARSYVLARLDENTRRLHPQVAAEASLPRRADYEKVILTLASDIQQARARGVRTVLYFVYAGHGNVKDGAGYITLEDARLSARDLESKMLEKINPDQEHLIVDACYSYFLAVSRGPGGVRHPASGFSAAGGLSSRPSTGLLFSTSSAKESHEWAGFQAGVFSHEVRSGLYGAADADGNGRVSYREIAAFVSRANASIKNERYRPEVFARAPHDTKDLIDLSPRQHARIEFNKVPADHHVLEDERGVRILDFHNDRDQHAYLITPAPAGGRLYLRRASDDAEVVIPRTLRVVEVGALKPEPPRIASRGAANDAFESLFKLPFNSNVVKAFDFTPREQLDANLGHDEGRDSSASAPWRTGFGIGLLSASAIATGVATYSLLSANSLKGALTDNASQVETSETRQRIKARNTTAVISLAAAGGTAISGLLLLLWPTTPVLVDADPIEQQAALRVRGTF